MLQQPSPTAVPNPELLERRGEFERLTNDFSKLVRSLTPEQWQWSPAADAWSVAQVIDHLNIVHGIMLPVLLEAIREGHAGERWRSGPFRYSLIERGVIWSFGPNAPIRQQAPAPFRPAVDSPPHGVSLTHFADLQFRLIRLTEEANGLDLAHIRITSPVWPRIRISLGAWFLALIAHEENHLSQVLTTIADPDYPSMLV
jgi:hypothetical protein